jgi:hypothetical protein
MPLKRCHSIVALAGSAGAAPVLADLHPAAVGEHRQGGDAGQVEERDGRQREALEQDARDLGRVERASGELGRVHGSGAGGE